MSKRSVCVQISSNANEIMVAELERINEGKSNRRGDDILTKPERCSQIIDEHYRVGNRQRYYQGMKKDSHG